MELVRAGSPDLSARWVGDGAEVIDPPEPLPWPGHEDDDQDVLVQRLRDHVAKEIGAIAKPRQIMVVPELPKTRSGKIMRRLLKDVAEHRNVGDVTTLADSSVMNLIQVGMSKPADD